MPYFARGKNKIANPRNLSDIYLMFDEEIKEQPYRIDQQTFIKVCDIFYKEAVKNILAGKTFALPFRLGYIFIGKRKASRYGGLRYIDWPKTLEVGKVVHHLNEHTQGWNYFIRWDRPFKLKYKSYYKFVPTRDFKRALAKIIKNRELDYFELRSYHGL